MDPNGMILLIVWAGLFVISLYTAVCVIEKTCKILDKLYKWLKKSLGNYTKSVLEKYKN